MTATLEELEARIAALEKEAAEGSESLSSTYTTLNPDGTLATTFPGIVTVGGETITTPEGQGIGDQDFGFYTPPTDSGEINWRRASDKTKQGEVYGWYDGSGGPNNIAQGASLLGRVPADGKHSGYAGLSLVSDGPQPGQGTPANIASLLAYSLWNNSQQRLRGNLEMAIFQQSGVLTRSLLFNDGTSDFLFGLRLGFGQVAGPIYGGVGAQFLGATITLDGSGGPVYCFISAMAQNDGTNGVDWITGWGIQMVGVGQTGSLCSARSSTSGARGTVSGCHVFTGLPAGTYTVYMIVTEANASPTWGVYNPRVLLFSPSHIK
jgi:hypothetical protein